MHLFLDNGYSHVNCKCNSDLGLNGILGGTIKALVTKVWVDPFEEDLNLAATLKQLGYRFAFNRVYYIPLNP